MTVGIRSSFGRCAWRTWSPSDHRVRLGWAFCETLDLGALYRAIKAVEGHSPADPRILLALWLFATTEGVGSARALGRLCEQHVAYQWPCGGVSMNHKTLADFRVAYGAVLEQLLDVIAPPRLASSACGTNSTPIRPRRAGARRPRARAAAPEAGEGSVEAEPDDARVDDPAPSEPSAPAPRASSTDAEARVMKMADGGFRPAFNGQFAADTRSGAVAGVSVDNVGSDMSKMAPMSDAIAAAYGTRPGEHLADGGYTKRADIEPLAKAGVTAVVPVPKPRDPARHRFAPRADDTQAVAAWRARMGTDDAKVIYKQRAATAERVNAQARNNGLTRFIVRGVDKARAVACWYGLANNMTYGWRSATA